MPVEKGPLLACGKTRRVVGLHRRHSRVKWLFPVAGLVALLWYVVRVIPKPSRADHPSPITRISLQVGLDSAQELV